MSRRPKALRAAAGDAEPLSTLLTGWAERGWLRPLDVAFADLLWREVPDAPALLILAAALASHQLGRGHVCLDLDATLRDPALVLMLPPEGADEPMDASLTSPGELLDGLSLADWQAELAHPELVGSGSDDCPLVLSGPRLYLRRYWHYEQGVRVRIRERLARSDLPGAGVPREATRRILDDLFPSSAVRPDWQKLACAVAARNAFSIITGGPGTGKTTTVIRLLALLQALALGAPATGRTARPLRICLAAPTGKAAARLNAALAGTVSDLPLAGAADAEAVRAAIPVSVTTLHRLLGSRPDTRRLRHHAGNRLALDVLVIDEASMVDLEMMAAVLEALPDPARLVLIGDKDQLASVEAGAVFGELCRHAHQGRYTPATRDWLESATGERVPADLIDPAGERLDQAIVTLRHSYRLARASGIRELAGAVNAGDPAAIREVLSRDHPDLDVLTVEGAEDVAFRRLVIDGRCARPDPSRVGEPAVRGGYRHYLEALRHGRPGPDAAPEAFDAWAGKVLQAHGQFQVLCALRRGDWGVEGLNQRIARVLCEAGLIPASTGWYPGRPVLVTRNDYGLGLMNGDIGMTLARPGGTGRDWVLRVAFPAGDGRGGIKWVLPSRLRAPETVYALTVHKSQGSEFSHAVLVLPDTPSPILTRELLYTGITRARDCLTLLQSGGPWALGYAAQRRVLRASGLTVGEPAEPLEFP